MMEKSMAENGHRLSKNSLMRHMMARCWTLVRGYFPSKQIRDHLLGQENASRLLRSGFLFEDRFDMQRYRRDLED